MEQKKINWGEVAGLVTDVFFPIFAMIFHDQRQDVRCGPSTVLDFLQTLGIDEQTAFDMHIACFSDEVREQLGLATDDEDDDEDSSSEIDLSTAKFGADAKEQVSCIDIDQALSRGVSQLSSMD